MTTAHISPPTRTGSHNILKSASKFGATPGGGGRGSNGRREFSWRLLMTFPLTMRH